MSRAWRASILLLFLASCGGRFSAPDNLNNACAIVTERPDFLRAMQATDRKWGVPVYEQMAMIHQESHFVGNAKPPHRYLLWIIPWGRVSSAYGYSQALSSTWDEYRADMHYHWSKRDRFRDASDFLGWYINGSWDSLHIPKTDVRDQYLAYHEGRAGYRSGSYRNKPWLINVANEVASRSDLYRRQLATCP